MSAKFHAYVDSTSKTEDRRFHTLYAADEWCHAIISDVGDQALLSGRIVYERPRFEPRLIARIEWTPDAPGLNRPITFFEPGAIEFLEHEPIEGGVPF